ncbi:MAG: ATP-binding protein [Novosphingobium sp.]
MTEPLGRVTETDGIMAMCRLDRAALLGSRGKTTGDELAASSVGGLVKIRVADRLLIAIICDLHEDLDSPQMIRAQVEYLGEGMATPAGNLASFRRGVDVFPMPGDPVDLAAKADFDLIYAPPDQPHIMLGMVHPTADVRAPILFENLLGRHFAIVGSTGTGKSTLVSLLLDRIVDKAAHAHVVILDPHGEYASAFGDRAQLWNVGNLQLPYWAMNLAEHCEAFIPGSPGDTVIERNILSNCLQRARARNVRLSDSARVTPDSPVPYQLADLTGAIDEEAGRLEKLTDASRFTQLRLALEHRFSDPRFSFIFNPDFFNLSLERFLGDLLRIPDGGKPISIIDLAGVPTEVVNLIVATLSRLVLDYAIRTPRDERAPMLLVCEEAHRYLPRERSAATAAVQRQLERIAREGRKYGVCLGIVSQRPSELSSTALSQCGTVLALRLNNVEDQAQLKAGLSEGARSLVDVIASLRNRECIAAGDGVPTPMRIRIDTIAANRKPDSADECFAEKWQTETAGPESLAETVRRWREGI